MSHTPWIIYGAAGTTGTLIAEEAIRRGHQPLLAGRSAESLASLGKRLGLPWLAIGLDEPGRLERRHQTSRWCSTPPVRSSPLLLRSLRPVWQPEPITWISRVKFPLCNSSSPVTRRHERAISP